jgi:hypothetical protein
MPLRSSLRSAFSSDAAQQHSDRRDSPRYDMSGEVFLKGDSCEPKKLGMVRDISLGGAFVTSQDDLPAHELLRLQFKIGADFEMSGHICRKDQDGFAILFEEQEQPK